MIPTSKNPSLTDWSLIHSQARLNHCGLQSKTEVLLAIAASKIPHKATNNNELIMFREPLKPKVDFYPSTCRACISGKSGLSFGTVDNFLMWYAEQ